MKEKKKRKKTKGRKNGAAGEGVGATDRPKKRALWRMHAAAVAVAKGRRVGTRRDEPPHREPSIDLVLLSHSLVVTR